MGLDLEYGEVTYTVNASDYEAYVPAKMSGNPDSWAPAEGGYASAASKVEVRKADGIRLPDMDLDAFVGIYMQEEGISDRRKALETLEEHLYEHLADEAGDDRDNFHDDGG